MRTRALLTAGATALLVGLAPAAAVAQDVSNDPGDLDSTFVPTPSGAADGAADAATDDGTADDALPNTGGGMALAGGLAVAGAAALRRRHT